MYFNLEPANGYLTYHVTYTCIYWCTVFVPRVGDMREEDMVVLLSERAAREIYKKWVDTLKVSIRSTNHCTVDGVVCVCVCDDNMNAVGCFGQFQAKKIGYQFQYRALSESNAISGRFSNIYTCTTVSSTTGMSIHEHLDT